MSTFDRMAPFISTPWLDRHGRPLAVRPLPGLRSQVLRELQLSNPGLMSPECRDLLSACSGLAGTALGHIDFTGCWYPEEASPVFSPCLTLAIDDEGRRWIAEPSAGGLPGRVWCLFTDPEVAIYVSEDLVSFLETLWERTCQGGLFSWLQDLNAQAQAIWAHRRALALRPYQAAEADTELAAWLRTLPPDAYVYDLRAPMAARGWPYGLAGPAGRLFRYGRLPVFAVAGPPIEGSRIRDAGFTRSPSAGQLTSGNVIPIQTPRFEVLPLPKRSMQYRREERLCA